MQKEMHLSSNLDGASLLICILYAHFRPALAGLFFFHHDLLVYLLLQLRYMGDNAHQVSIPREIAHLNRSN